MAAVPGYQIPDPYRERYAPGPESPDVDEHHLTAIANPNEGLKTISGHSTLIPFQ